MHSSHEPLLATSARSSRRRGVFCTVVGVRRSMHLCLQGRDDAATVTYGISVAQRNNDRLSANRSKHDEAKATAILSNRLKALPCTCLQLSIEIFKTSRWLPYKFWRKKTIDTGMQSVPKTEKYSKNDCAALRSHFQPRNQRCQKRPDLATSKDKNKAKE